MFRHGLHCNRTSEKLKIYRLNQEVHPIFTLSCDISAPQRKNAV